MHHFDQVDPLKVEESQIQLSSRLMSNEGHSLKKSRQNLRDKPSDILHPEESGLQDSIIINQKIPDWGLTSQLKLNNPVLDQISNSLEGGLEQIRTFWNEREDIYRQTKNFTSEFKLRESSLLEGGKKILQIAEAHVQNIQAIGNQIEVLMMQCLKFGNSMINFINRSLQTVFSEQNLQEKIESVADSDPDERNSKIMLQVKDYYQKLEPVFKVYLAQKEISQSSRVVRAEYIDNFYHRIEKRLNQLKEESGLIATDSSSVAGFKQQIQRYFFEEYFHNSIYFLSLVFLENSSLINLLKDLANQAIRYDSHFQKLKYLDRICEEKGKRFHQEFTIECKRLQDWVDDQFQKFEDQVLQKISGNFEEKPKSGGFFGFLGMKSESSQSEQDTKSFFEVDLPQLEKESQFESAFFVNLKKFCNQKISNIVTLTEKEEIFFDCTGFDLSQNFLQNLVENSSIAANKRCLVARKKSVAQYVKFLRVLPATISKFLVCAKLTQFCLQKIKLIDKVSQNQSDSTWHQFMQEYQTGLKIAESRLQCLKQSLSFYFQMSSEITAKNSLQFSINTKLREVQESISLGHEQESLSRIHLNKMYGYEVNYGELYQGLQSSIKNYEIVIKSDSQLITNNFFTLDDSDLSKVYFNFESAFGSVNQNCMNKFVSDNSLPLDSSRLPEKYLVAQQGNKSQLQFTSSDNLKFDNLSMMIKFFKKIQLILKHLVAGMKNFGLESLQMYTRYRFDSLSFLALDKDHELILKKLTQQRSRDISNLQKIKNTLQEELSLERTISTQILESLLNLVEFLLDFSETNSQIEQILFEEWQIFTRHFSEMQTPQMLTEESQKSALNFFDGIRVEKKNMCRLFKLKVYQTSKYDEYNEFILEQEFQQSQLHSVYCLNIDRMDRGIKILHLKEYTEAVSGILRILEESKQEVAKNCAKELQKIAMRLESSIIGKAIQIDQEISKFDFDAGYLLFLASKNFTIGSNQSREFSRTLTNQPQ